jgi:hypothetical protein
VDAILERIEQVTDYRARLRSTEDIAVEVGK